MKDWWHGVSYPIRLLFSRNMNEAEADLDAEIRAHLEMEIEENIEAGMSPREARYAARRAFGSVTSSKQRTRDVWGLGPLERFWQDVRYGARMLAKKRLVTAVAVLSLGIGIGANTAVFTVLKSVLYYAPPLYQDVDRLVTIWETAPHEPGTSRHVPVQSYLAYKEQDDLFVSVAAVQPYVDVSVRLKDHPEQVTAQVASASLLTTLGVIPLMGRNFLPEEEQLGGENTALLGYGIWQSRFGGDSSIVGQTISIDSRDHTIVGVLPRGFWFANGFTEIWMPLRSSQARSTPDEGSLRLVGRLKPGVGEEEVRSRFESLIPQMEQEDPAREKGRGVRVDPVRSLDALGGEIPPGIMQLLWALGLVLLLACTNIANVMVARGTARQKETAIRSALGAGRTRLIRQLLTESLLLAVLGGALGLLLTLWSVQLITYYAPGDLSWTLDIRFDAWVFGFALFVSLVTGVLSGLAPALADSRVDVNSAIKEGGEGRQAGGGRQRLRGAIVVAEVALTLMLVAGVGLLIKSFLLLHSVAPGFDSNGLMTFRVELPESRYGAISEAGLDREALFRGILRGLEELPDVESAAAASVLPPNAGEPCMFSIDSGTQPKDDRDLPVAACNILISDYFATLGVPLLSGRSTTDRDSENSPWVVVINDAMARRYWPDKDAVGKRVYFASDPDAKARTVVGIVANLRNQGMILDATPEMFIPYAQMPTAVARGPGASPFQMTILMRTKGMSDVMASKVRGAVAMVDPELAISDPSTMEERLDAAAQEILMATFLNGPIIGMALVLTCVGIYGILSFSVSRRVREFGIRIALGAGPGGLMKLVLGQGLRLVTLGVVVGILGALALNRMLSKLLLGIVSLDPLILLGASALLVAVAGAASFVPARRATKVDPVVALRCE